MFIENMVENDTYDPFGVARIQINEFYKHSIPSGLSRFQTVMVFFTNSTQLNGCW
jgi:hypothetical protein